VPKLRYERIKFTRGTLKVIEAADQIIGEYAGQGHSLTLRQLYYQFVARDLLGNSQKNYKRLGDIISKARRAGMIDWNAIVDRTRFLRSVASWDGPEDIVRTCAAQFTVDHWADQPNRPEVWVEKDALVGVMEVGCDPWQCPYFSCRGYASDSELWSAAMRLKSYAVAGQSPVVYHFGDHDPSGIDMTRDIEARLQLFGGNRLADVLEVKRIALNMEQVEEYSPPPNPAKETDSRFEGYWREYGEESWELDALSPTTLSELIAAEMKAIIVKKKWKAAEAEQAAGRAALSSISGNWSEVRAFLADRDLLEE
jgi:hypothetical protein